MKQGKISRRIVGSNTPSGYISFVQENLRGMERVFMLLGAPGTGKSTMIRRLAQKLTERGLDVELWLDGGTVSGLFVPKLLAAVVDVGLMEYVHPENLAVIDEVYNLEGCLCGEMLRAERREIIELSAELKQNIVAESGLLTVYAQKRPKLYAAKGIRISEEELESIAADLAGRIFAEERATVRHFFAEGSAEGASLGFAEEQTKDCKQRFLLCGEVDELLSRVGKVAKQHGFDVDLYYDYLAPSELKMLVLPQLAVALLDAELTGLEAGVNDEIIEVYAADDVWENPPKQELDFATSKARRCRAELAAEYSRATDFSLVDEIYADILAKLWQMAGECGL